MACYHPLKGFRTSEGISFSELRRFDNLGSVEIACMRCIGCRMQRAADWETRVMHEAAMYERNSFVTLTYATGNLPANGSLDYRDFQLFMKRLRKAVPWQVRFYMCGEYGEKEQRPHYHACLFNLDFDDQIPAGKSKSGQIFYESKQLTQLWGLGKCSVQPLVRETAGYCARYIMKKVLGDEAKAHYTVVDADGVMVEKVPEFANMSLRPGIGARWFERYHGDVFPHDFVILDGTRRKVPRYYSDKYRNSGGDFDSIEFERQKKALLVAADNTDERRQTREIVHQAKVRNLKREI